MKRLAARLTVALALGGCTGPVVEVKPPAGAPASSDLAILLSGDGGWAAFDVALAQGLADLGVPVVGVSSLQFFWRRHEPDDAAKSLANLIDAHLLAWGKTRVILVGYSFGADALPFLVTRFPTRIAAKAPELALIAPTPYAAFEVRIWEWLGFRGDESLSVPEALKAIKIPQILCVYGTQDADAVCPRLAPPVRVMPFAGGHHLTEQAGEIAQAIVDAAGGR